MAGILQSSIGLMRSRLSRRIVFWVFLSILVIEGIIFVPAYFRRRTDKLQELESVSSEVLFAVKAQIMNQAMTAEDMLTALQSQLKPDSVIVGAILYDGSCRPLDSFGEIPTIDCIGPSQSSIQRQLIARPARYEVAWPSSQLQEDYTLIVRHNASQVGHEMSQYVLAIAGLVILISAFVTFTTVLMLERLLINPLLRLRDDLLAAGEALAEGNSEGDTIQADFYSLSLQRSDELGDVAVAFSQMFHRVDHEIRERRQAEAALKAEQEKSERLLRNILPVSITEKLKAESGAIASRFDQATILFADIVNFTGLSSQIAPTKLVGILNEIFSTFDCIAERFGLEKIKTIGDAYMVVGGLPTPRPDHAEAVMMMAIEMLRAIQTFERGDGEPFQLRIGINTGPVVAGVIGIKKFSYDLWGDAVNLASRMESHGVANCIQVSQHTYQQLQQHYKFIARGPISIKGRGKMNTYLYYGGPVNPAVTGPIT